MKIPTFTKKPYKDIDLDFIAGDTPILIFEEEKSNIYNYWRFCR